MREINPQDISLVQRSFSLAVAIVLLFAFTKVILRLLFPVLILTLVIFLILKFLYRNNKFGF